jgi:hypothetical protein
MTFVHPYSRSGPTLPAGRRIKDRLDAFMARRPPSSKAGRDGNPEHLSRPESSAEETDWRTYLLIELGFSSLLMGVPMGYICRPQIAAFLRRMGLLAPLPVPVPPPPPPLPSFWEWCSSFSLPFSLGWPPAPSWEGFKAGCGHMFRSFLSMDATAQVSLSSGIVGLGALTWLGRKAQNKLRQFLP